MRLLVEVFPIAPERWIAVIEAPDGPFSTEARSPDQVPAAVSGSIEHVLGSGLFEVELLDDQGIPWGLESVHDQCRRLKVDEPPRS